MNKNNNLYDWCLKNNREIIIEEWDYEKNGDITPYNTTYGSCKKVWFKCKEHNHEWEAKISKRTISKTNCPYCAGKKILISYNDLQTTNPELMEEWDFEKNEIEPTSVTAGSNKRVWWKCSEGHSWEAPVARRVIENSSCPYCSNQKVLKGYNDLATTHPEIAKEWHSTKNGDLTPYDVVANSNKKVWWICSEGHEWETTIAKRHENNCPYCANTKTLKGYNDLATTHPEIAKEWHPTKNGDLTPYDVTYGCRKKVWWQCQKHKEHVWEANISNRSKANVLERTGCPHCAKVKQTSLPEKAIYFYIKKVFKDSIANYKTDWLGSMELDIYIPSIDTAIEYDGFYYHNNKKSDELKDKLVLNKNINLIRVKELKSRSDIIKKTNNNIKSISTIYNNTNSFNNCVYEILKHIKYHSKLSAKKVAEIDNLHIDILNDYTKILNSITFSEIENSLSKTHPKIAKQWNTNKNGDLRPEQFTAGSSHKVWWQCDKHKEHIWVSSIEKRALGNRGCPYCSNKKVLKGYNDLASQRPEVAKYWDYDMNTDLTPEEIIYKSSKTAYFKCDCGHKWHGKILNKNICTKCNK